MEDRENRSVDERHEDRVHRPAVGVLQAYQKHFVLSLTKLIVVAYSRYNVTLLIKTHCNALGAFTYYPALPLKFGALYVTSLRLQG